jgi:hypothetical protein
MSADGSRASGRRPAGQPVLRRAEATTWGPRPGGAAAPNARTERLKMQLVSWKPLLRGSLRGFARVELAIGLTLIDCPAFVLNGKAGVSLPSKLQIDRDGRQRTDASGKPAWAAVLEWRDRSLADRFSAAVVAEIRAAHPGALDGEWLSGENPRSPP